MSIPSPIIDAVSASESASLHGHKAKTPIIAGAVSGACVGVAWIIGFIIYFYKRHRREKRAHALGFKSHREMLDPPKRNEAIIIPPDPAIVEAGIRPGEVIYDDPKLQESTPKHAHTIPFARTEKEKEVDGEGEGEDGETADSKVPPDMQHATSAPARVPTSVHASLASHSPQPHEPPIVHPRRPSSEAALVSKEV